MGLLQKELRDRLRDAVLAARGVAEAAATTELERMGVGEPEAPGYLNQQECELRRRLRVHGRQLGDARGKGGRQELTRLCAEAAYEHWHRMLFARFLAQNGLLIHPEHGVAVTLEECEELARIESRTIGGPASRWEMAARFAAHMLPQIFRQDSPTLGLTLPPNERARLEALVQGLPREVLLAQDSLGWVYQFWQSQAKDRVNASGGKIGADELPAVTQLFTEHYMVAFLLDNSLGAWWARRRMEPSHLRESQDEEALRRVVALPGMPLEYLRFVREESTWRLAAGGFEAWPEKVAELRVLDPCCGSGHFLTAAFDMLVAMRVQEEALPPRDACDAVLRENLFGLELDARCVEIAAFALALEAWRYPGAGGYRPLPAMNLACSGLPVKGTREEWEQLGGGRRNLRLALGLLHEEFKDAPILGSLIDPARSDASRLMDWQTLGPALADALSRETTDEQIEMGVMAQGLAKAALLLAGKYHLVATNVPYLTRGKQCVRLREFCEERYEVAKGDLATVFLGRCLQLCVPDGTAATVTPQNWLFLSNYRRFREKLLKGDTWQLLARLGPGAFQTISGEVVKAALQIISRGSTARPQESLFDHGRGSNQIRGMDVSAIRTAAGKAAALISAGLEMAGQMSQLGNPDARVSLCDVRVGTALGSYCSSIEGLTTGDLERFVARFWEGGFQGGWEPFVQNVEHTTYYGGRSDRILWEDGEGALYHFPTAHNFPGAVMGGRPILGRSGIRVTQMGHLPVTMYTGEIFGKSAATVVPHDPADLPAIWCFCSSPEYHEAVRRIDQKMNVTNATLVKVPFDLAHWTKVAAEKYPNGLPKPYSDDPTQWIFHGHPAHSTAPLQVAVARLLSCRWPAETEEKMELSEQARALVAQSATLDRLSDADGIVCIPTVGAERPAAERLLELLGAAYGEDWSSGRLDELLAAGDSEGKTLDYWLRERFFVQHAALFHHRPFIWQIWDGLKDGFSVLVSYHGLNRANLEKLTYTYLGEWIRSQESATRAGVPGSQVRLDAAKVLKDRLAAILEGEAPLDIFVRWKPLQEQPMGWDPDLDDGVRINIRPFMTAEVLRHNKPPRLNVKWDKDRGKDLTSSPWYHLFKGERINDHHLSLAEKRAAREGRRGKR